MWKSVLTELIVTYELVGGLREKILAILQKNSKLLVIIQILALLGIGD